MDWKTTATAGLVLGGVVTLWQVVSIAAGLTSLFVPVATLVQVLVVVGALAAMRSKHGYLQQLAAGTALSAVAAAILFVTSLLSTAVLFPGALETMRAEVAASMEAATAEEVEAAVAMIAPLPQAVFGAIGTLVTGLVVAGLAAIGLRKS